MEWKKKKNTLGTNIFDAAIKSLDQLQFWHVVISEGKRSN